MSKCLRCGAGPEWLQGKIPDELPPQDDTKRLDWLIEHAEQQQWTGDFWFPKMAHKGFSREAIDAAMRREGEKMNQLMIVDDKYWYRWSVIRFWLNRITRPFQSRRDR